MLYTNRWGHILVARYPRTFLAIRFPRINKRAQQMLYRVEMGRA